MENVSTSHIYSQMVSEMYKSSSELPLYQYSNSHTDCAGVTDHLLLWNEVPGTLASHNCTKDSSPCVSSLVWHSH